MFVSSPPIYKEAFQSEMKIFCVILFVSKPNNNTQRAKKRFKARTAVWKFYSTFRLEAAILVFELSDRANLNASSCCLDAENNANVFINSQIIYINNTLISCVEHNLLTSNQRT